MPKAAVYDMTGKQIDEIELSDAIFGITPNLSVMHDAVKIIWLTEDRGHNPR